MSDLEFDVLDELYFVQSFDYLRETIDLSEEKLKEVLKKLLTKAWIKCFVHVSEEGMVPNLEDFEQSYKNYHYLATKEGLLAHNGR